MGVLDQQSQQQHDIHWIIYPAGSLVLKLQTCTTPTVLQMSTTQPTTAHTGVDMSPMEMDTPREMLQTCTTPIALQMSTTQPTTALTGVDMSPMEMDTQNKKTNI